MSICPECKSENPENAKFYLNRRKKLDAETILCKYCGNTK
jgi:hypothetical protein